MRLRHLGDEVLVAQRRQQPHPAVQAAQPLEGLAHCRARVHRNDELNVGELLHQRNDRAADRLHARALVLSPVRREQDAPQRAAGAAACRRDPLDGEPQRIDAGIAGDVEPGRLDPLPAQIIERAPRRAEVPARQPVGGDAIELLGKRRAQIAAAQPGLDMRERNAGVERRQRRDQHGRGIALGDDHVRRVLGDHAFHRRHHRAGEHRQTSAISRRARCGRRARCRTRRAVRARAWCAGPSTASSPANAAPARG